VTLAACEWIFGTRPLDEIVLVLGRARYDAIEITGEPERDDAERLLRLVEQKGLRICGCTANCDRPGRDLAHPERDLRRQAVDYYCGCVDLVARLGGRTIGLVPSAEGRLAPLTSYEREWRFAVESASEVANHAAVRGVGVAVEPLNRYETFLVNRVEQALAFAQDVGVAGVGITADLFHMNIEEADPEAALERARGHLLELHLADSNRRGLGRGHLPLERLLAAAGDPTLVVEVTGANADELDEDVAKSASIVRAIRHGHGN
jgi:sugar phosphate isomerase/epimerase